MRQVRWEELEAFAAVVDGRSLAAASRLLSISEATVRKRVERVEALAQVPLFSRTTTGLVLTTRGEAIAQSIGSVTNAVDRFERALQSTVREIDETLTLTVTEGLGAYWIAPRISRHIRDSDFRSADVRCQMDLPDLQRGEADLAIHFGEVGCDLVESEIVGHMTVNLYAGAEYAREHGLPETYGELKDHAIIRQFGPQLIQGRTFFNSLWEDLKKAIVLNVNLSSAHYEAIRSNAGIGALPSYAEDVDPTLVIVPISLNIRRPILMSSLKNQQRSKKVRNAKRIVHKLFDSPHFN